MMEAMHDMNISKYFISTHNLGKKEWKTIWVNHEITNYEVKKTGEIRNRKTKRPMK